LDNVLRIGLLLAMLGLAGSTVWLGAIGRTGAAGITAPLCFGLCVFMFLSRFKRFKGLGFEGDLWENEMEEAAELRRALKDLSERVGEGVYWNLGEGSRMGRVGTDKLFGIIEHTDRNLKAAGIDRHKVEELKRPWHKCVMRDLANPITERVSSVARSKAKEVEAEMAALGSPLAAGRMPEVIALNEKQRPMMEFPKQSNKVIWRDDYENVPRQLRQTIDEFRGAVLALYHNGRQRAHSTGWPCLDELMTIREGELSVVTGVPGAGKSEFVDALMVNLADRYGWRFAVCSFENPPDEHLSKLAEKRLGMPFWEGPTARMGEADLSRALDWAADHFVFIRADDEAPTLDWILENARSAVMRYGVRGLVIDPYNEIEHKRPTAMSETEYVSQTLGKVKRFGLQHGVHVWFVAHPAKMHRESGSIPTPTLYDISGSANWANKADLGVVVHRDPGKHPPETEIYIRKVRFKSVGRIGMVTLRYDRATGRYSDPASDTPVSQRQWWQESDAQ